MKLIVNALPPTVNQYKGVTCRGGRPIVYKTKEAKDWQSLVTTLLRTKKRSMFKGRVEIFVTVNYSNEHTDPDNINKCLLDCLTYASIIKDDSFKYIEAVHVYRGEKVKKGQESIELEVEET